MTGQDPAPFVVMTPSEELTVQIESAADVVKVKVPLPEVVFVLAVMVSEVDVNFIEFEFGYTKLRVWLALVIS